MVRRNLDNIEIIEPPLNELTKKHSYKRTCLSGCGCLLLVIIAAVIGLRVYIGPGPTTVKVLPANFPTDIPVYDKDAIEDMTFISGKYKNRGIEIAAFFPKIILSPMLVKMEQGGTSTVADAGKWKGMWQIITAPVGDHRDTIQINWRNLDADPSFIIAYYRKELTKKNFKIEIESEGKNVRQFSFSREDGTSGSLYVQGGEVAKTGTDFAILTVNLPTQPPQIQPPPQP